MAKFLKKGTQLVVGDEDTMNCYFEITDEEGNSYGEEEVRFDAEELREIVLGRVPEVMKVAVKSVFEQFIRGGMDQPPEW